MMPTRVVLSMLATLMIACGSAEPAPEMPEPEPAPDTPVSSDDGSGTVTDTADPIAPGPCAEGGVPDDGDAEGCEFRVNACCYASPDQACAAAGCAMSSCQILESYPAQVRCE